MVMDVRETPLWRNRDFVLLWAGEAISSLGTRIGVVAYPLVTLALTHSATVAGVLTFTGRVPWFLFTLPAGAVVDRINRRVIILVFDAAACVSLLVAAAALVLRIAPLPLLFVASFVEGTAFIFMQIAQPGALRQIVTRTQLPDAVAQADARESAAALLGAPIGGALLTVGAALPFVADAASYLFSFIGVGLIKKALQEEGSDKRSARMWSAIREGGRWLWQRRFLRTSFLLVGASNFFTNGLAFALVVIARRRGASPTLIGAMLALLSLGGLAGAVAAPYLRRLSSPRLIVIGFNWIGVVAVLAMLAFLGEPLALGGLFAVMLFFGPVWNATIDGYRIAIVPDRLQGRVSSVASLFSFAAIPLGPLLAGLLIDAAGGSATIAAFGAWIAIVAVAGSLSRSLRESGPSR